MTERARNAWSVGTGLAALLALYLAVQSAFVSRREWDVARDADAKQLAAIVTELRDMRLLLEEHASAGGPVGPEQLTR